MMRFCAKAGLEEVRALRYGMDFRRPEFRREVFLRFYEFHLKYRAHPGCVYSVLPFLFEKFEMDWEAKLWFCFLNGNTQHALTSYLIFKHFPDFKKLDVEKLDAWFNWWFPNLQFDTDRRHHKAVLVQAVKRYKKLLNGRNQIDYFTDLVNTKKDFTDLFKTVQRDFYSFGRLSSFSYLEYLRVAGLAIECDNLFLEDIAGSRSHRNGICKVLGRDDLDWHESNPGFDGKYSPELLDWLKEEARQLLTEAKLRLGARDFSSDINYFTLESTLCTYKSWHRPNRRYPGCYLDMFRDRMNFYVQRLRKMPEVMDVFDEWRATIPAHLRTESNPGDVGLKPEKQNHYLMTGQPVMMDEEWPCFKNDYNDRVKATRELF